MVSPFDSEEGWWARGAAPQMAGDPTPGMLERTGNTRIGQAQDLARSQVESKRNLGDIQGEAFPNALKTYWQGAEEARRGTAADTQEEEARQRMELAKTSEGRAAKRFGWESEEQPLRHQTLQQGLDLGAANLKGKQAEESWLDASDNAGGPTHRSQMRGNELKQGSMGLQLTQAQIDAQRSSAGIAATNAMEQRFLEDAESVAYAPDPQGAADELLKSPAYGKIPVDRRQRLLQASVTKGGMARTASQNQADMTWEVTGPGQDFHEANRTMARTERLAQLLQEKGNVHSQYAALGGNLETDEARTARAEASATLRKMGDETGAKEVEGFIGPGTSVKTVINRVAARKLEESAAATEAEVQGLNPADQNRPNVRQALMKAQELRVRAKQLRDEAGIPEKTTLIPNYQQRSSGGGAAAAGFSGAAPPPAARRTNAPAAGAGAAPPPADEDPLGLFRKGG